MFMFMPAKADPAVGRLTAMPLSTSQYGARPSIRRPMDTYHSRMHTIHTIQGCTRPASFPLGSPGRVFKVPLGRRDYWLLGLSSAGAGLSRPLHQCIWHVLKGNCHHFQYQNGRKYRKNPDEQKKKRNLKAVFLQPQWLVKDLQLQADDVTGAKKPFYHTNPYIID